MAYRRSLTSRAKLIYEHQHFAPSYSYLHRDDNDHNKNNSNSPSRPFNQSRSFRNGIINSYTASNFQVSSPPFGTAFSRYMSTSMGGGTENVELIGDVSVNVSEQAAPVVNEVAIAAADSFFPVAVLQYLVDYVHTITGFNWWGSIIATTLLIRWLTVPFMLNHLKATSKFALLKPQLEEVKEEMQNKGMNPTAVSEGQEKMKALFKKYGVNPYTPFQGLIIQGPVFVSFYLAISNMVEKVPSFKEGGAYWFVDLTTPDAIYIFPILTALTFWITVECNLGMEGNPSAPKIKNVSRGFVVLTVPFTASFPKAIFCYWITSNLFSLVYGLIIKRPMVKKCLGISIAPELPASIREKPALSFIESMRKYAETRAQVKTQETIMPVETLKPENQKIATSSNLSKRIRNLEKEVKGKKKSKKRR